MNNFNYLILQGGDGTSLTHWEKRLFQNEAMTGTVHTQYPVYSRLTFALMEDTGWYIPDYSKVKRITVIFLLELLINFILYVTFDKM